MDHDMIGRDDLLGTVILPVEYLLQATVRATGHRPQRHHSGR